MEGYLYPSQINSRYRKLGPNISGSKTRYSGFRTVYFRVHRKFLDPRKTTKSLKISSQNLLERRPEIVLEISGRARYFRPKVRKFRTPKNCRNTNMKTTITFASGLRFLWSWACLEDNHKPKKIMYIHIIVHHVRRKPHGESLTSLGKISR